MSVHDGEIRDASVPLPLDDTWPRLVVYALFWVSTVMLATVLLVADPVSGSFVVGIPLLLVVLARERGLGAIPTMMFGAAIGASMMFTIFLGAHRRDFDSGLLAVGLVIFLVWVGTYPIMLKQLDRQYLREHFPPPGEPPPGEPVPAEPPPPVARLYVVRLWMTLLAVLAVAEALGRDLLAT